MRSVTMPAHAKLNLTLDILRKRPDGYHDLRMVMQSIALHDVVTVRTETGSGEITVHTDREDLPGGPDNIAWKAARAFYDAVGQESSGTEIVLEKHIPMQAGMAGGSADGAAVLLALQSLYAPEMPREALEQVGLQVGSDVPFCVRGGTALAEGRGEVLTDLPPLPDCWIAVCKPDFGLSTPALFRRVRVDALQGRPDHDAMKRALAAGDLPAVARQMRNVFEEVLTVRERQEIMYLKDVMLRCGACNAVMTGSGPTVFGLFERKAEAERAVEALRNHYSQLFLTTPLQRV
ncbi:MULTISPECIES: 4-(cytidine 5'-diphospho)-2-C-methyl-D-erythritol kinase [environmental samples]|uniref:4-(cytidine 5'-diphospho)-2-C-methyl-D-erythritol kinase n=1 Tax=environmental samples TaxID=876090 RepID=UPI0003394B6A|nr:MULTISPECIES: 4-(cytidine 5'-diphospho)-2-C-methyl-D-erythritol kinase [environmental samples]CDC71869.1 4-diphosphocytidyl-2-C-methyl-D-erythritol kinase [Oscillibacter sp. CAG:155]